LAASASSFSWYASLTSRRRFSSRSALALRSRSITSTRGGVLAAGRLEPLGELGGLDLQRLDALVQVVAVLDRLVERVLQLGGARLGGVARARRLGVERQQAQAIPHQPGAEDRRGDQQQTEDQRERFHRQSVRPPGGARGVWID
jgi:hypothetical protein